MSIFVIPSVLALLAKVAILFVAYRTVNYSKPFFNLVVVFGLHNVCELLIFLKFGGGNFGYVLIAYYMASIWGLAVMLLYALKVSGHTNKILVAGTISLATILSLGLLFTNLVIGGERSIGYVLTAVRGPLYWTFHLYSIAMYLCVAASLVYGFRKAKDHVTEIQCLLTLLALAPLMVLGCAIMLLMNFDYNVNATAILPLATTAFLWITLLGEGKHKLTDIRRFLPWSPERKTSSEIMDIFSAYSRDDVEYRQAVSQIEKLLVLHKYQKSGENASATAELMGMPRSSLYSIFNRLEIGSKGSK